MRGVSWMSGKREMFSNIRRDEVGLAAQHFFEKVSRDSQIPVHDAFFRIHKGGIKRMDGVARRTRDWAFQFIPLGDLQNFLTYELWSNDQFAFFIGFPPVHWRGNWWLYVSPDSLTLCHVPRRGVGQVTDPPNGTLPGQCFGTATQGSGNG